MQNGKTVVNLYLNHVFIRNNVFQESLQNGNDFFVGDVAKYFEFTYLSIDVQILYTWVLSPQVETLQTISRLRIIYWDVTVFTLSLPSYNICKKSSVSSLQYD